MKVSDVSKLSALDRFLYWIKERHQIHLRRSQGKPKPWTDDEIMQSFFFTNPYRENDKVTQWFRENVRDPLRDQPQVLMATVIFRWFNYIPTGELLKRKGLLTRWDCKKAIKSLSDYRDSGNKVFTGAFMIPAVPGMDKVTHVCVCLERIWNDRKRLIKFCESATTMEAVQAELVIYPWLGGFMAYEVVCDLCYTYLLENATDKLTWCNPGPGALRGIYRIMEIDFGKGKNATSLRVPKDWAAQTQRLLKILRDKLKSMPAFEMREVEMSLCEFDKYERLLWGDGRSKRKYNGKTD